MHSELLPFRKYVDNIMGVGRIFTGGEGNRGKFHFTNLKLRETHFSLKQLIRKYQYFKIQGGSPSASPSYGLV